jgi:hypothetical protein
MSAFLPHGTNTVFACRMMRDNNSFVNGLGAIRAAPPQLLRRSNKIVAIDGPSAECLPANRAARAASISVVRLPGRQLDTAASAPDKGSNIGCFCHARHPAAVSLRRPVAAGFPWRASRAA